MLFLLLLAGACSLSFTGAAALVSAVAASSWPDCSAAQDGHFPFNGTAGPFGPVLRTDGVFDGSPLVAMYPKGELPSVAGGKAPLLVFMHGVSAKIEMYLPNLRNYVSHGFVVVFPYIKSPEADCCQKPVPPTNTNGEFILHGIQWARAASQNESSPLFGRIDLGRVVIAGHSMGATCSIMAGTRLAVGNGVIDASAIKMVSTQHPGICGPFGPPPWPDTWLTHDLLRGASHFPVLFTTAENDAAFWPAPMTAKHERGCFVKALRDSANTSVVHATYVEFSKSACLQDGARPPFDDGGHNCPFKTGVETPWVLTWMKQYAQQDGQSSNCAKLMGSIRSGFGVNATIQYGGAPSSALL